MALDLPGSARFSSRTPGGDGERALAGADLRRTRRGLNHIADAAEEHTESQQLAEGEDMNTPYGLPIVENCMTCRLRKDSWFCQLSSDLLRSFSASSHLTTYPGGAILFVEGQMPRGGFVLCSGKVKLSTTSREGKVLILKNGRTGRSDRTERGDLGTSL